MPIEIERKFLLKDDSWKKNYSRKIEIKQGYLSLDKERNVRVRLKGETGIMTIKGATNNFSRKEFEYEIPRADALELLDMCHRPIIEKIRYEKSESGLIWEIDEFFGDNAGLVVAEVELTSEQQEIEIPSWLGKEVSNDVRYFNSYLVKHPFSEWG